MQEGLILNMTKISTKWFAAGAVALLMSAHFTNAKAVDMTWLWPITGSGVITEKSNTLASFDRMKIDSRASVDILTSDAASVKLEVDDNIAAYVSIAVRDGTLYIEDRKSSKPTVFRITVMAPAHLRRIATSGSAAVRAVGWRADELSLSIGETSAVMLTDLHVDTLRLDIGDKGVLHASGVAKSLSVSLGGSSALNTQDLNVETVSLEAGGSCQASVWATSTLTMSLGGSCAIRYFGHPKVEMASGGSAVVKHVGERPAKALEPEEAMPSR